VHFAVPGGGLNVGMLMRQPPPVRVEELTARGVEFDDPPKPQSRHWLGWGAPSSERDEAADEQPEAHDDEHDADDEHQPL
jgi:hypothetical protein